MHNNVSPSQLLLYRNRSQEHWPLVGDHMRLLYDLSGSGNYVSRSGKHVVKGVVVALHDDDPNLYKVHLNNIADQVIGPQPYSKQKRLFDIVGGLLSLVVALSLIHNPDRDTNPDFTLNPCTNNLTLPLTLAVTRASSVAVVLADTFSFTDHLYLCLACSLERLQGRQPGCHMRI